jgi:hypothetical protein
MRGHPAPNRTYSYVSVHMMCNCFDPACARLARLHPAGLLEFLGSAFVVETRHTLSSTNHFILMSAPSPSPSWQGPSWRAAPCPPARPPARPPALPQARLQARSPALLLRPIKHSLRCLRHLPHPPLAMKRLQCCPRWGGRCDVWRRCP